MKSKNTPARKYFVGMGKAVADRTINRKIVRPFDQRKKIKFLIPRDDSRSLDQQIEAQARSRGFKFDGDYHVAHGDDRVVSGYFWSTGKYVVEEWEDVADRVSLGNALLEPRQGRLGMFRTHMKSGAALTEFQTREYERLHHHMRQASILMSGRHLQHGDASQPDRNMEVFVNCLEGSTKILTMEYGPIEIEKIAGQSVSVIAGDGVPRPARINDHGKQDVFEIVFRQNTTGPAPGIQPVVRATANHRWKLLDGTITDTLKVGDVIAPATAIVKVDPVGVIHGLLYGDGSGGGKDRADHSRVTVSQGRTYATIRVCKGDAVRDEIHRVLDEAGYSYTTPPSTNGDRIYYIGKFPYAKELPFTNDPEYIAGFIRGWWLADGSKTCNHAVEISTANEAAANWLRTYSAYAGYVPTVQRVMERKPGDGSYANGKSLHIVRIRQNLPMKVQSITPVGTASVYCPEEPVTSTFVLANGLLTGNCASAAATFIEFYLLLNGSGVGRAYDDNMIRADLNHMPIVTCTIDWSHKDVERGLIKGFLTKRDAEHLYAGRQINHFQVPDSREGWAKALEIIERMAFERRRDEVLILDFSGVREKDAPIMGMQGRPASGPGPLMAAIMSIAKLRDAGMAPWRAAMYADHYAAECVLVGGARRAARMATKTWRDLSIFEFIQLKRGGFLWSSNNSVTVDQEFRDGVTKVRNLARTLGPTQSVVPMYLKTWVQTGQITELEAHAYRVMMAIAKAAYFDKTGEPGIINQDRLTQNDDGFDAYVDGLYAESKKFKLDTETLPLMQDLAKAAISARYRVITNPCGEIVLYALGGYCVIADVVPFHAGATALTSESWDDDAEDAFRTATRALIRTNLMDCLYSREVRRTNRIGVGITGFHEWAYARFGYTWRDIVDEEKSKPMWLTLSRFKRAIVDEAARYANELGVTVPHTNTTFKPAGTTSKIFGLTEGAHLPSMREFLRWVQFRNDDPLVKEYEERGYPVKRLKTYEGTTVVGFPTKPAICELDGGDWVVTAAEATPEEQYRFLRLLEKYWLTGVEEDGVTPLTESGNQISYTLKYDPAKVDFDRFFDTLIEGQFSIRCCSVMPQTDTTAYEYQPEQSLPKLEYERVVAAIQQDDTMNEDIGVEHIDCGAGACPVDFKSEKVA